MTESVAHSSDFSVVPITMVISKYFICQGGCGHNTVTERQQNNLHKAPQSVCYKFIVTESNVVAMELLTG